MASASPFSRAVVTPMLKVFSASSDEVVASIGTLNFCTDASDSPSLVRRLKATLPRGLHYLFLARRLALFLGQRISVSTIHRLQAHQVLAAQVGNRPRQQRLAPRPQADLLRH